MSADTAEREKSKKTGPRWGLIITGLVVFVVVGSGALIYLVRSSAQVFYTPSMSMAPTLRQNDRFFVNKLAYVSRDPARGDVVVYEAPPEASVDRTPRVFVGRVIGLPGDAVRITPGQVRFGSFTANHRDLADILAREGGSDHKTTVKLVKDGALVNGRMVRADEIAEAAEESKAGMKIVPGLVYVNGKPLNEPYTAEDPDMAYPMSGTNPEWIVKDQAGNRAVKIPPGRLLVMGDNRNDSNDSRFWGLLRRESVLGKVERILWPEERSGPVR